MYCGPVNPFKFIRLDIQERTNTMNNTQQWQKYNRIYNKYFQRFQSGQMTVQQWQRFTFRMIFVVPGFKGLCQRMKFR
jgi:hypothetical protein